MKAKLKRLALVPLVQLSLSGCAGMVIDAATGVVGGAIDISTSVVGGAVDVLDAVTPDIADDDSENEDGGSQK
jgi:hypothetical protein